MLYFIAKLLFKLLNPEVAQSHVDTKGDYVMKVCLKLVIAAAVLLALPSASRAATVGGNAVPHYNHAEISSANSTVDLIPLTNGAGNVWGVMCVFPSTAGGASVNVEFTVDGGTTHTITLDPTYFPQDENDKFMSGWVPMDITFSTSIHVQLNNTGLGTATIECFASWGTN